MLFYNKRNFNEVFLKEFLDDYIFSITKVEPFGIHPDITEKIISQLKALTLLEFAVDRISALKTEVDRLEKQKKKLDSILEGNNIVYEEGRRSFFPLIAKDAPEGFYGILESATTHLSKTTDSDKFIIVPSEKDVEQKILEQCKKSWNVALDLSRNYVKKPHTYHEVIISFDKKDGFYEGNSLGIALTLSFLEQLLKFYNPAYIIKIKEQTAFTGGILDTGHILPTGEEIIKQKVSAVFFSLMNSFVIPKCEEVAAQSQLNELKVIYQNRNLKIIPVEETKDVLNRRDVIDIRKQKLVVRTSKFAKQNWVSAAATVLLSVLFAFLFVMDYDDNPAALITDGTTLFVKNKNGKILWTKNVSLPKETSYRYSYFKSYCRIYDVDDDKLNEVLLSGEKLLCFDNVGRIKWKYQFIDSTDLTYQDFNHFYSINIIDTITINNIKCLILMTRSTQSYSSAICKIDIKNGKSLPGKLWCSGHVVDAIIKDLNADKKREILAVGVDNGYEEIVIFSFDIDNTTKLRPSTGKYTFKNLTPATLMTYIRLPRTDYDNYLNIRIPAIDKGSFIDDIQEKKYRFATATNDPETNCHLWIALDYNLKDIDVIVDNKFRVIRDSLIARGELNPPYSGSKEYVNLYKDQVSYWDKGKWVKRSEIDK